MPNQKRGFFITLEGPDGAGKSTQFKFLAKRLRQEGLAVQETREPGGDPLSEKIRSILLTQDEFSPAKETELLLFLAARAQHVHHLIRPEMEKGRVVICERFSDSTYAYQVGGRKISAAVVKQADRFATGGLEPDLTLLFDLSLKTGLQRAFSAKKGLDRLESESMAFYQGVRRAYLALASKNPQRIKMIRADRPLDEVTEKCWSEVLQKMPLIKRRCHGL